MLIHDIEWEGPFDFDYWVDFLKLVTVKLPEKLITDVDQLVKAGIYHSRSDAIRAAVRDLLRRELWHTSQG
jgi:antitoxin ParD1/3/4